MKRILLFPPRFTAMLKLNQGRIAKVVLMILVFITALFTRDYRGNYQMIVNNNLGGVFYVLFGSLLISVIWPRLKCHWATLLALGATCLLEFIQYFRIPFMLEMAKYKVFAYLFGNSFNPKDFIFYAVGALLGLGVLWLLQGEEKSEKQGHGTRK